MILLLLLAATARVTSQCAASDAPALRLYPWRDEPLSSPVQRRHFVKAPTVFGNTTHFCGYRGNADAADLDAYEATGLGNVVWPAFPFLYTPNLTGRLDDIKRRGMVLVDVSNYVPGDTDNCGPYAPGAPNPTASIGVCAYKAPRKTLDLVNEKLGDSFTGMDNGEQDGRWIGYATQMNRPAGAQYHPDRQLANAGRGDELKRSFLQFSRFFEKMTDDLGSRMSSLNSIWYPHYFAKTGLYTSLGAETAQGLPNAQLFYAFLRGAAKAYGKKWWGNASIWNRWGHKTCASTDACDENGTSLSLLRRLMYSQILYNSMFFGYEGGQTCTECDAERVAAVIADGVVEGVAEKMAEEDSRGGYGGLIHKPLPHHGARYSERTPHNVSEQRTMTVQPTPATTPPSHSQKLTPIGKIQIAAKQLVQQHPDLGAHLTNCAVVFDFFAGFAPPRHLYSSNVYRLWGNLPFDADSYWGHGVLNLLYPGYVDSSYYTSEKGFQVETPYGDGTDILLSDAPGYILQRYPVVIVGSRLRSARKETAAKLTAYVESGGTLVLTADASESLGPLLGAAVPSMSPLLCKTYSHNTTVLLLGNDGSGAIVEPHVWSTCPIVCLKACKRVANVNGSTVAVQVSAGNGTLLLFASSGVASSPTVDLPIVSAENKGLSNPYPMLTHVRMLVGARLADQTPFTVHAEQTHEVVGDELSFITTRISSTKYVLGMANNGLNSQPFKLRSNPAFGRITAVKELTLLDNAGSTHEVTPSTRGYKPNGFNASDVGRSTETTIAGLDMRLFMIDVAQATSLQEIETPVMPAAPNFRALPLPELGTTGGSSMHDSILLRPTFFDHFDTVVVDWRYMDSQASKALIREGRWAFMQSLAIVVDFSSGINLYPDLRLCNNSADDYARSIETIQRVIDKMSLLVNATTATQSTAQYSNHAIFTLHRFVENYYSAQQVNADFIMSVKHISTYAAQKNVTLHLRVGAPGKPPTSLEAALAFLTAVGRPRNLKIAASSASMVTTGTSALVLRDLAEAGQLGMVLVSAPVIERVSAHLVSIYGPLASCTDKCATGTAAILAQATAHHALVVVDAALPGDLEAHQDAYFDESVALENISRLPFPPPPPPPPPPCGSVGSNHTCVLPRLSGLTDDDSSCYALGTEVCGLCEISGKDQQRIVMQCNPDNGEVIADYWKRGGGWAGAYGNMFGHLPAADIPCTKIRLENRVGIWNISLNYAGTTHSWALAPKGYLPPASVTSVICSPQTRCTPAIAPHSSATFSCVKGVNFAQQIDALPAGE